MCIKILLKRFSEAMIGQCAFHVLCMDETIKKVSKFCNNVPFRMEYLQIMAEVRIQGYVFNPVFGCLTRSALY